MKPFTRFVWLFYIMNSSVVGAFLASRRRLKLPHSYKGAKHTTLPPKDMTKMVKRNKTAARYQTPYTINDSVCPPTDRDVLQKIVSKHIHSLGLYTSQKPTAAHTLQAFEQVKNIVHGSNYNEIILDSGCGTGRSTLLLGGMYPNHVVIGVDRSLARLSRNSHFRETGSQGTNGDGTTQQDDAVQVMQGSSGSKNVILVRAELSDFWRCCLEEGWKPTRHYLLYPNPYPKKARLKNRWYAHPAFPLMLQLGGDIVVRSNWEGYLKEFALSVRYASQALDDPENFAAPYVESSTKGPVPLSTDVPWTNFEKKYMESGEPMYELELLADR